MTYEELIEKCKDYNPIYGQKHHIIPKSVGGPNTKDNIIRLSWLTHYYAHKLLAEENPDNKNIQNEFKRMGTIEQYLKKCYSLWKQRTFEGKTHTEESKKKMSEANKGKVGELNGFYGKQHSEESRQKMSESHKGYHHTEEWKKRHSEDVTGEKNGMFGTHRCGEENPMWGKHLSDESKKKLSEAHKGKSLSEEHKRLISESSKGRRWFNNEQIETFTYECPEGFIQGRLKRKG